MAYNSNKGPQHTGDLQYEGDPNDVQIDFENDEITLKTGAQPRVVVTNTGVSGSGTLHHVGAVTLSDTLSVSGAINTKAGVLTGEYSGSSTLHSDGAATFSATLAVSGAVTAASFSGDGSALTGLPAATSLSGTTVEATTGVETSGYLKVTGSSTLADITATTISASSISHVVGAATFSNTLAVTGGVTAQSFAGDGASLTNLPAPTSLSGTTVETTTGIETSGYLKVTGSSTLGPIAATTYSGSGTCHVDGAATFSSTLAVTGAVTATSFAGDGSSLTNLPVATSLSGTTVQATTGVESSGYLKVSGSTTLGGSVSGSSGLLVVGSITSSANLAATGSLVLGMGSYIGAHERETLIQLNDGNILVNGVLKNENGGISGSALLMVGGAATFSSTIAATGSVTAASFAGDGSSLTNLPAPTSLSGTTVETTTGVETSGYLKVSGSSTLGPLTATTYSGSGTSHVVGAATFSSTLAVSGNITTAGDLILDDGGSIKEGGGTAAITIDASGEVTKIGQDSPSTNEVLTWDGAKWAAAASGGGTATAVSGTTAELTTGVETSGYLKVSGSSTLGPIEATEYSGSGTVTCIALSASSDVIISGSVGIGTAAPAYDLHVNGAGVTIATIDGGASSDAYLRFNTNGTEKAFIKQGSGGNTIITNDVAGKNLQLQARPAAGAAESYIFLNGGTEQVLIAKPVSASSTLHHVGAASFSSTVSASGSVSAVGLYSTELISGSLGLHVDEPASFGGTVTVTASVGIGIITPKTALDVHHNHTTLANDTGGGEVVKFGTGTTTAGKLYYLHSASSWQQTDLIGANSGGLGMLGIALGTNPATDGMLLRGFFDAHSYLSGTFVAGTTLYISAPGYITTMRPSGAAEVVRVLGTCTTTSNVIYFNPSPDYLVVI